MQHDEFDQSGERRRYHRLSYPPEARCQLLIGGSSYDVVEISRRGIRFLNPDKVKLSDWIGATIVLHDGSSLSIEGKVVWTDDHLLGMQLLDPVPYSMILSEQCYLIQEQVPKAGAGRERPQEREGAERRVYLVRHGEPVAASVDPQRPLSDKGRRDVERMASFLSRSGLMLGGILHSGKLRAAQTAELLGTFISSEQGISARGGLEPDDAIEPLLGELLAAAHDIMIVGHLPFLDRLARALLGAEADQDLLSFEPGAALCLLQRTRQHWRVEWMVVPDLIR